MGNETKQLSNEKPGKCMNLKKKKKKNLIIISGLFKLVTKTKICLTFYQRCTCIYIYYCDGRYRWAEKSLVPSIVCGFGLLN